MFLISCCHLYLFSRNYERARSVPPATASRRTHSPTMVFASSSTLTLLFCVELSLTVKSEPNLRAKLAKLLVPRRLLLSVLAARSTLLLTRPITLASRPMMVLRPSSRNKLAGYTMENRKLFPKILFSSIHSFLMLTRQTNEDSTKQ